MFIKKEKVKNKCWPLYGWLFCIAVECTQAPSKARQPYIWALWYRRTVWVIRICFQIIKIPTCYVAEQLYLFWSSGIFMYASLGFKIHFCWYPKDVDAVSPFITIDEQLKKTATVVSPIRVMLPFTDYQLNCIVKT